RGGTSGTAGRACRQRPSPGVAGDGWRDKRRVPRSNGKTREDSQERQAERFLFRGLLARSGVQSASPEKTPALAFLAGLASWRYIWGERADVTPSVARAQIRCGAVLVVPRGELADDDLRRA